MSLREQANEIRNYLDSCTSLPTNWLALVPAGEHPESAQLFLADLDGLFRILMAPEMLAAKRRTRANLQAAPQAESLHG